jgi:hypothetical protein
MKQEP